MVSRSTAGRSDIDRGLIDPELLRIASQLATKLEPAAALQTDELDVSHIAPPELFYTAELSGIAVPVATPGGGGILQSGPLRADRATSIGFDTPLAAI